VEDGPDQTRRESGEAFVRNSAVMSVGTGLSRLTGFVRVAAMAYALGVAETRLTDTYNVANTTPNIVYELALGGILSSVFIPVFVERLESGGKDRAWRTARTLFTFTTLFLVAVMIVGIVLSGPIIHAYTFSAHGPQVDAERTLGTFFLKWFMPQIVFYGIGAGVATGLLNAHRRFAAPMFAPIANNLVATATFLTFSVMAHHRAVPPGGITTSEKYVLAVGTSLGVVVMSVLLLPSLRRVGFRWRWALDFEDAGFRRIGRLAGWAFLYVVVNQIGYASVIVLASRTRGGYTAYTSAFQFFQLPYAIFAVSIMTALLPTLSSHWSERDPVAFRRLLAQGIRGTAFIVVPATFGYLALATPMIRLLLQHGVMRADSTHLLSRVLVFFSLGLFPFCAFQLLLRAFYAMQDTRTPALINVGENVIFIAGNIVLVRYLSVGGLALSNGIGYTFASAVALVILRRRLRGLEGRRISGALARILVAGVAAGATAYGVSRILASSLGSGHLPSELAQVGGAALTGLLVFLALAVAFRLEELQMIKRVVLARVRGSR
jgi:putative peptidoglycan lipid II flippase